MGQDQPHRAPDRVLELLWGRTAPPSRGPKPALSLEQIVGTAVHIADAEGLGAVSMRRVADELGFTTMSLYRHVPSKDDLVTLMWDAAGAPPPDPDDVPEHWRDGMTWWAQQNLAVLRRHRWFIEIPISTPPMGPNQVQWMECALRALSGTGLYPGEMMGVLQLVSTYILSAGRLEVTLSEGASSTGVDVQEWDSLYGQMLAKVVDPAMFPTLAQLLQAGIFDAPDDDAGDDPGHGAGDRTEDGASDSARDGMGADIMFGLEIILDGVEALINRRNSR